MSRLILRLLTVTFVLVCAAALDHSTPHSAHAVEAASSAHGSSPAPSAADAAGTVPAQIGHPTHAGEAPHGHHPCDRAATPPHCGRTAAEPVLVCLCGPTLDDLGGLALSSWPPAAPSRLLVTCVSRT